MNDEPDRSDPDRLLEHVKRVESRANRGRLKIFLGYAAGVGKTFSMLQAAQGKRTAGVDVVIAYVEAHGRSETDALLADLERIPLRRIEHRGIVLREMDLDAVLARAPKLAIVDELAHTNAPRSRHDKRWQDVEEMLAAGIDVYTTLNVQHIESLNDVVAQLTGVRVQETIPDRFVDSADEFELVDLPIAELRERIAEGKVYGAHAKERATHHFFQEGNLFALRELALRRVADRVDAEAKGYLDLHAIRGPHAARERILVCVSSSPLSERLVRSACRLAQSLDAEWHAVYVETPHDAGLSEPARQRVAATLRLAAELGARARSFPGADVALGITDYAREHHVTRIVVGKPMRSGRLSWLRPSLVDRIIRESGTLDVHVVRESASDPEAPRGPTTAVRRTALSLPEIAISLVMVALATGIGIALRSTLEPTNLVMMFLLIVVVTALRFQRSTALIAALASVLGFDFFLIPPYGTLAVSDVEYVVTFAALLVVALVTSGLQARARAQSTAALRREAQTAALYECSRALSAANSVEEIVRALCEQVGATFGENVAVWLPGPDGVEVHEASMPFPSQVFERGVAQWVFDHGKPAGRGTDTLGGVRSFFVPLQDGATVRGALALYRADDAPDLSLDESRLFESFAARGAAALERLDLAASQARASLAEERERMKSTLLDSVSHDLRTPLAAITGAISSLRDDHALLDERARRELLDTAANEAGRLDRLVGNLLDMTRLEAGGVALRKTPCDLEDLIGSALEQLTREFRSRRVRVIANPDLGLVPLDFTLACQALVNVLSNGLRYSPADSDLEITTRVDGDFACFDVLDRGPGIPEEHLERIFEKFHRVPNTAFERGSGLGLSITRAILEAHGGRVTAANRQGGGACFTLRFPRVARESATETAS